MKLLHKTIMLAVLMALLSQAAQALPFVPTTDPESSSTEWYYLTTEGRLMVARSDKAVTTTVSTSTFAEQWCFVGTESSGYKIYNRQYKKYLGDNGYMLSNGDETIMYYKPRLLNTFYIWRYDALNEMDVYLYYDTVFGELTSFFGEANESEGCFEAISVTGGSGLPFWTYHDINNVGYRMIKSGSNLNPDVNAYLIGDGDCATQYEGNKGYGYVTFEASEEVSLEQYSIVTANNARTNFDSNLHTWAVFGSNDGKNLELIERRYYYPMPLANTEEVVIHVNDNRKFRYFHFASAGTLDNENLKLAEVWFNQRAHTWGNPQVDIEPTCGTRGQSVVTCEDCHVKKTIILEPTGRHNYVNGVCTVCGNKRGETVLLCNGQSQVPYYAKFMYGIPDNNVWPDGPQGWEKVNFDDSAWNEIAMPTASYGHTGGPFSPLYFNSVWVSEGQYLQNCRWFRRTFELDRADPKAIYTLGLVHDDNALIYINGRLVVNAPGWTPEPANGNWEWQNAAQMLNIPAQVFIPGKNVLAVYIQQTAGGAYFDCDLVMQREEFTGDVDGNGSVDGTDLNTLINIILGKDSADNYNGRANVDGQGGVDGNDLNALINILLGK